VRLKVTNTGYEPNQIYNLRHDSATTAVLKAYRPIIIGAAQSVRLHVLYQEACGDESIPCRQIVVDAPAGALIDLEVSALDDRDKFGVMVDFPLELPPLQTSDSDDRAQRSCLDRPRCGIERIRRSTRCGPPTLTVLRANRSSPGDGP
jgi:hypothetical protein